jgi:hypothetical protein
MENLTSLLDELYRTDSALPAIEKVAEDSFRSTLQTSDQLFETDSSALADWSTERLIEAAQQLGNEKTASESDDSDDQTEALADEVGGRVMAHAMMDEFRYIKVAMANGLCRVCKESPLDIAGTSVCSACHE